MDMALKLDEMLPSVMSMACPCSSADGIFSRNICSIATMPAFHRALKLTIGAPVARSIGIKGLWNMSWLFTAAPSSIKTLSTNSPSKIIGGTVALLQPGLGP